MILKAFPDIHWLRKQAKTNFQNQRGINQILLPNKGWPNVVLNASVSGIERRDIVAPFSLFLNTSGTSLLLIDGKEHRINEDVFYTINKGQTYDLILPEKISTTTFNIHFGEKLFSETYYSLINSPSQLLDEPEENLDIDYQIFERSRWKSPTFLTFLSKLKNHYLSKKEVPFVLEDDQENEFLSDLLTWTLTERDKSFKGLRNLSSLKKANKVELMSRLNQAIDYAHSHYNQNLSLQELSQIACLSKYHFLRSFKEAFGCTPHQYIMRLRLEKAVYFLVYSKRSMAEIAIEIGFEEPNSFGRLFKKVYQTSPHRFRKEISNFG